MVMGEWIGKIEKAGLDRTWHEERPEPEIGNTGHGGPRLGRVQSPAGPVTVLRMDWIVMRFQEVAALRCTVACTYHHGPAAVELDLPGQSCWG